MANITGTTGNDSLLGTADHDFIDGGDGDDTIFGNGGNDNIRGGLGNDSLDGGTGWDTVIFWGDGNYGTTGPVNVNLAAGTANGADGNDVLSGFEAVIASDFDDIVTGDANNNDFEGRGGNDFITGGGGFDRAVYWVTDGAGVHVNLATGRAYDDGFGGVDTLVGITGLIGSMFDDTLIGDAGNNTFVTYTGDDFVDGGAGTDDQVQYYFSNSAVTAILNNDGTGTVTGKSYVLNGDTLTGTDTLQNVEGVAGSDFNDSLVGSDGHNALIGNGGNDTLLGNGGDDYLVGGAGNDYIDGGVVLDRAGFSDLNQVSYEGDPNGVKVDLSGITGDGSVGQGTAKDGWGGTDTLKNVQIVRGSNFNDTITGSSADIFEMFQGGKGNDTIDGGAITTANNGNRVSYQSADGSVTVDLLTGTASGADGSDRLYNINQIRGSNYADNLSGSNTAAVTEFFEGRGGDDTINGRGGFDIVRYDAATGGVNVNLATGIASDGQGGTDTLANIEGIQGTRFNDTLIGGHAQGGVTLSDGLIETFNGGAGNDFIDGGQGYDRVEYHTSTDGILADLDTGLVQDGLGGTDTLVGIEAVRGSRYADTLLGSDAYFESFEGGAGDDTIDGKGGWDRVDYRYLAATGVNVNLAGNTATDGQGGTDTLYNIEWVRGSNFHDTIAGDANDNKLEGMGGNDSIAGGDGNDTIEGGNGDDSIDGGNGNDHLQGDAGNDTINGGDGDDYILGGAGNDVLNGGGGWNWAAYWDATVGVTVNLLTGRATGGGGSDTLSGFQAVAGSNFNDTLIGDANNNDFNGGAGNDRIEGGGGKDRVGYWGVQAGVSVNLATGQAKALNVANAGLVGTDTLINISGAVGTDFADSLVGNAGDNDFEGWGGDDTIDGGAGRDSVWYGIASGAVNVNLAAGTANDGQGGVDTLISIENIGGSMYDDTLVGSDEDNSLTGEDGNDSIDGGKGNDWLSGGAGNDTILGGEGSDILIGGGGNDVIDGGVITDRSGYTDGNTLSYEFDPNGIVMDLSGITGDGSTGTGTVTDGWGGTDTVSNVNFIRGSAHADSILGSSAAIFEMFYGTAGNDTIDGGTISNDGANRISYQNFTTAVTVDLGAGTADKGSLGQDQLSNITQVRGSSAADSLVGSDTTAYTEWFEGRGGNDTIDGKGGYDMVRYDFSATMGISVNLADETATDGQGGTDTLRNIEGVRGSGFADTLVGNGANNRLEGMGGNDNISGGAGNDTLDGGVGNDTLDGGDGDDSLLGGEGNDSLVGGAGNDTLVGGSGNDTLDGGDGTDAAGFAGLFSEYVITRVSDTDLRLVRNGNTTIVRNVEYFGFNSGADVRTLQDILGNAPSDYADTLTGTTGDDSIDGGAGNDSISGLEGNDTLIGGTGNDTLVGGEGDDTYEVDSADDVIVELENGGTDDHVNVKLPSGTYVLSEHVETATVTSTAAVSITGNEQDNVLTGNAAANTLTGNGGDDLLQGLGGNDTLNGGAGDDTLDGGAGTDRLVGGAGDDTYIIDVTTDAIVEAASEGTDTVQVAFSAAGTYTLGANLENATVATSNPLLAVNLTGNTLDNILTGNAGKNVLNGGAGNDTLIGGGGNDTVDGGEGTDILVLQGDRADYNVQRTGTLAAPKMVLTRGNGSDATIITASNIESFAFDDGPMDLATLLNNSISDFDDSWEGTSGNDTVNGLKGNDTLDGADGNDTLYGGDGNDSLIGSDGNDSLMGDAGNDTLLGGGGNDTLNGGAGNDRMEGGDGDDVYVVDAIGDVVVESSGVGSGTDLVQVAMASGIYTLGANVENATVTSTGAVSLTGNGEDNVLTGNAAANTLKGMDGDDHLLGMAGNDILEGGDGNDTLDGGLGNDKLLGGAGDDQLITGGGNDTVDGGEGDDTLVLAGNQAAWTLSRTAAGTQFKRGTETVTFSNIETVVFDDATVSTSTLLDRLETEQADTLVGGSGNDTLNGKGGNDVIYGHGGNDSLLGGAGADTLDGGAGDDTLDGGAGIDSLTGGAGDDTYVVDVAGDVVVELASEGADLVKVAMASGAYTLTANVENAEVTSAGAVGLTGNAENNHLKGNAAANTLKGMAGNDSLEGLAGNDILEGGDGNDTLDGGLGNDKLLGGAGDDRLITGGGNDTVDGGEGNDTLVLAGDQAAWTLSRTAAGTQFKRGTETVTFSNIETVVFDDATVSTSTLLDRLETEQADTLVGGSGNDTLNGKGGNDVIYGHDGNDSLLGGAGDDKLYGGDGNDQLFGDAGNDLLDGGEGDDTMAGGAGNDTYVVDSATDVVTELANGGTDLVQVAFASAGEYLLANNVEQAIVTSSAAVDLTGNALANVLTGNEEDNALYGMEGNDTLIGGDGDDTLDGGDGIDRMSGGLGDDTYIVNVAGDVITELADQGDNDLVEVAFTVNGTYVLSANVENGTITTDNPALKVNLTGNASDNVLTGNAGANMLSGGLGDDTLIGGLGNDTLDGGAGDDVALFDGDAADWDVTRTSATDFRVVHSSGQIVIVRNVEQLKFNGDPSVPIGNVTGGTPQADVLYASDAGEVIDGKAGNDTLYGGAGNDTLIGGVGTDSLIGGAGNDTYEVDVVGDKTVEAEGGGVDQVNVKLAAGTYILSANVENATVTSTSAAGITGNDLANYLTGNAVANTLTGGAGNDTLDGGEGSDRLVGGLGDDTYIVNVAGDVVTEQTNQGTDTVQVAFLANGTYVLSANVERGTITVDNAALKVNLTGSAGDNALQGNAGDNLLNGMGGNDRLAGGLGNDTLTGGAGADTFVFDTAISLTNVDTITDFNSLQGDKIQLSAAVFMGLGGAGGTVDLSGGYLSYDQSNGNLVYDADGAGAAAGITIAILGTRPVLEAGHIELIA